MNDEHAAYIIRVFEDNNSCWEIRFIINGWLNSVIKFINDIIEILAPLYDRYGEGICLKCGKKFIEDFAYTKSSHKCLKQ